MGGGHEGDEKLRKTQNKQTTGAGLYCDGKERKSHPEINLPVALWLCVFLYNVSEKKEKLSSDDPKKKKGISFKVLQFQSNDAAELVEL